jgi:hypothetical protein
MTNIINYEDDIFYLTHIVRKLADGLKLDIDPNTFKKLIIEEVSFLNKSIEALFHTLKNSQLKINRDLYFKSMLRLNRQYVGLLNDIINHTSPFALNLQEYTDMLLRFKSQHMEYITELEDLLSDITTNSNGDQEIISEEEMRILLTDHEEE